MRDYSTNRGKDLQRDTVEDPRFPITESVEEALKNVGRSRRDDFGYCYYTFRIHLPDANTQWHPALSKLIDAGWQLQGTPVILEEIGITPRHVVISMLHAEPRPLQIRGELRIRGEIQGGAELHSGSAV